MKHILTNAVNVTVQRSMIRLPATNPNHMPADKFRLLVDAIRQVGWLQDVLIAQISDEPFDPANPSYLLVDGYHRLMAGDELQMVDIQAKRITCTADEARVLQIMLNRLRGDLNLTEVATTVDELLASGAWEQADLTLTGYTSHEIDGMMELLGADDDLTRGASSVLGDTDDQGPKQPKPRRHRLEVFFATAEDRDRAKKVLQDMSGTNPMLGKALLELIDMTEEVPT